MTKLPTRWACLLVATAILGGTGCTASRVFRDATQEEARQHWDLAVLAYDRALQLDPQNSKYRISLVRAKARAAQVHYDRGRLHRSAGQLDMAALELEQSVALDPTNDSAVQELRRTREDAENRRLESQGGTALEKSKLRTKGARATPPMLNPSSTDPIQVSFNDQNVKKIYGALAAAAGINVIYDPQLKDDKFTIDLRGMSFQKGLETVMRQAGHFYKVIDERTILVAQDTNQNRKEYEDLVIRTFFLSNGDVKDVSTMVRSILDLRRLGTIQALNAIVIRDTADKVAVAEKIIEVNDKAKAEVVIDVELLEIQTTKMAELGTKLSAYSTTGNLNGSSSGTSGSTAALPWKDLFKIGINDFNFSVPAITFNFVKSNSDAELLARPQLRIAEGEKAQLTIGDRVPIPVTTVNTQQAVGGTGIVPITSFQYQDVGIKIEIEPRVHHNKEVTMKLTVEVSKIGEKPVVGPNGQEQPIIGTRTITSTIRLKDGETNVLAGLMRSEGSRSKGSIPFLGDLPILGSLFSNNKSEDKRTDLLLTLTPHIVRAPQISEEDMLPIWVGTENNVSFSGLNTRLESPQASGSPFDESTVGAPARPRPGVSGSAGNPLGGQPDGIKPVVPALPAGGLPNDPFKRPDSPIKPRGSSQKETDGASLSGEVPAGPAAADGRPHLGFDLSAEELTAGRSATVFLTGLAGMADLNAMELTLEWDSSVAEVTAVSPGAWRDGELGPVVRFEAERVPGRARVQLGRAMGQMGLPSGVLAELTVRGVAPGTAYFRVSAAAAAGKAGGSTPVAQSAALTVR